VNFCDKVSFVAEKKGILGSRSCLVPTEIGFTRLCLFLIDVRMCYMSSEVSLSGSVGSTT
jgi:hypothetical protein